VTKDRTPLELKPSQQFSSARKGDRGTMKRRRRRGRRKHRRPPGEKMAVEMRAVSTKETCRVFRYPDRRQLAREVRSLPSPLLQLR